MYVVTFYSFKGGVGRTSAAVNVAAALARAEKRVLLVDFDLEAPGLTSYPEFAGTRRSKGVVDFITEYLNENVAPKVDSYISEVRVGSYPLWIMSAGKVDSGNYSEHLAGINWDHLYSARSGYLLFEDLRQQWDRYAGEGFDYVFIDSRTGHTDTGGICTRQLPDAVVVMYLPTRQNIDGLEPVVSAIRNEPARRGRQEIALHFCPSNVPNLDDEKQILSQLLSEARARLGYHYEDSRIHHYNSMDLLNSTIFTVTRPNTRLASEYFQLRDSIIAKNVLDRDGALEALRAALEQSPRGAAYQRVSALDLEVIQQQHGSDPEMADYLAQAFALVGDHEQQLSMLELMLSAGHERPRSLIRRAICLGRLGRESEALSDWTAILGEPTARGADIARAVNAIREAAPDHWASTVENSLHWRRLEPIELRRVLRTLMSAAESVGVVANIMEEMCRSGPQDYLSEAVKKEFYILSLIRLKRYADAMSLLGSREKVFGCSDIGEIFNYAVAEWGETGEPPLDLFERVIQLDIGGDQMLKISANYNQCLALAHAVLGSIPEAQARLEKARRSIRVLGRAFSCWSYLELSRSEFETDVAEMSDALGGARLLPRFMGTH